MRVSGAMIGVMAVVLGAPAAAAPDARAPVPSGRYEGYSPVTMAPYGRLPGSGVPALPRWLEVKADGAALDVTLMPEGSIRWRLVYGPHGLIEKVATVDAEPWTRSRFTYEGGQLAAKEVTGPGVEKARTYRYGAADGGAVERRPAGGSEATWILRRRAGGALAEYRRDGRLVRRDRYDARGCPLRTELHGEGHPPYVIRFLRDRRGRLRAVRRTLPGRGTARARPDRPDDAVVSEDVARMTGLLERHEVRWLLGAPRTQSVHGRGNRRSTRDDYAPDCWLNRPSTIVYDAADRVVGNDTGCICGFCVDAALKPTAPDVLVSDEHWTRGPWVRLDGAVDVTVDHRVMTPDGPRPAGRLAPGDVVLGADGRPRRLRSVERLPPALRRGANLRTTSGTFAAGGFLFESEQPRPCPPPP